MSRQYPIHVIDSDEDPTEGSFDSDATSVYVNQPTTVRATSDDTSTDAPTLPPTLPVIPPVAPPTVAESHHLFAETSRMRRTPRMVVRDFPIGPLAPRDKAPMVEQERLPEEPAQKRLRVAHLDWMPYLLREWRSLEGIPSTYETGESSHAPSSLPLTGEPMELTIPTLVAVIRTLFWISSGRGDFLRELQSDISRMEGDMASAYERLDFVESRMILSRETSDATIARVDTIERRARIAGFVACVCVMLTVVLTAIGLYLPYFR